MSRSEDKRLAERWLSTADEDLRAAKTLVDAGHFAQACFMAQQAAEKAVKALWYLAGADPWGHSVQKLVMGLPQRDNIGDLDTWVQKSAELDRLYIPTRYPNGLPDLTPAEVYFRSDAERSVASASYLMSAVNDQFQVANTASENTRPGVGDV